MCVRHCININRYRLVQLGPFHERNRTCTTSSLLLPVLVLQFQHLLLVLLCLLQDFVFVFGVQLRGVVPLVVGECGKGAAVVEEKREERREKMNRLSRRLTPNQASYTSRLYLPLTSNNCDTFFNSSTCTARLLRSFNTSFSNVALRPCWCTCRSLLNANSLVCASNTSRSCCNASHLVCHSTVVCW
jgi:hypothetical protein